MPLSRQLKRLGISEDTPPSAERWRAFLDVVKCAYRGAEQDRYTLERSLMISSREMQELHDGLRRSEANFRVLVEQSPDLVFVYRGNATIAYVNPAMARTLGYAVSDLIGRTTFETFIHPDDCEKLIGYRQRRSAGEVMGPLQTRWVRSDGTIRFVESLAVSIVFDNEPAMLVMCRDVTEKLAAAAQNARIETALRASEERYRALFERSPVPMMLFDPESLRILAVNDAACTTYGYTRDEFVAMTVPSLKLPDDVPELVLGMNERRHDVVRVGVRKHRRKDGVLIDVDICAHAVTLDGRRAILSVNVDVSERRHLEEQLLQAQKMDAVGRLAGGIAHDFNNLLSIMMSYTSMLIEESTDTDTLEALSQILRAGQRSADLTRQLLTFSRQQPIAARVVDLNEVVLGAQKLVSRIVGEHIRLKTQLSTEPAFVNVDPGQIEQIVMNLVVNARDAMPNGGTLTIGTELSTSSAVLTIRDEGHGMDKATQLRIFEPFFTTKDRGKGTGLGLSIVFGVVARCAGRIEVESAPGCGATFRLHFPLATELPVRATPKDSPARATSSGETVLLVEDEAEVRNMVETVLQRAGYRTITAATPNEALSIVRALGDKTVDLLLTDVIMPQMNGRKLADQVLIERPGLKVLYMSGYTDDVVLDAGLPTQVAFLPKPITPETLRQKVRSVLDDPA